MNLEVNDVITLENKKKYIILKDVIFSDKKYYLSMMLKSNNSINPEEVLIFSVGGNNYDVFIDPIDDVDLLNNIVALF